MALLMVTAMLVCQILAVVLQWIFFCNSWTVTLKDSKVKPLDPLSKWRSWMYSLRLRTIIREDRWIALHKDLCQWDILASFAEQSGSAKLQMECAWKVKDWGKVRSLCSTLSIAAALESVDFAQMTFIAWLLITIVEPFLSNFHAISTFIYCVKLEKAGFFRWSCSSCSGTFSIVQKWKWK